MRFWKNIIILKNNYFKHFLILMLGIYYRSKKICLKVCFLQTTKQNFFVINCDIIPYRIDNILRNHDIRQTSPTHNILRLLKRNQNISVSNRTLIDKSEAPHPRKLLPSFVFRHSGDWINNNNNSTRVYRIHTTITFIFPHIFFHSHESLRLSRSGEKLSPWMGRNLTRKNINQHGTFR